MPLDILPIFYLCAIFLLHIIISFFSFFSISAFLFIYFCYFIQFYRACSITLLVPLAFLYKRLQKHFFQMLLQPSLPLQSFSLSGGILFNSYVLPYSCSSSISARIVSSDAAIACRVMVRSFSSSQPSCFAPLSMTSLEHPAANPLLFIFFSSEILIPYLLYFLTDASTQPPRSDLSVRLPQIVLFPSHGRVLHQSSFHILL